MNITLDAIKAEPATQTDAKPVPAKLQEIKAKALAKKAKKESAKADLSNDTAAEAAVESAVAA